VVVAQSCNRANELEWAGYCRLLWSQTLRGKYVAQNGPPGSAQHVAALPVDVVGMYLYFNGLFYYAVHIPFCSR
jgi:hypothetical protein